MKNICRARDLGDRVTISTDYLTLRETEHGLRKSESTWLSQLTTDMDGLGQSPLPLGLLRVRVIQVSRRGREVR